MVRKKRELIQAEVLKALLPRPVEGLIDCLCATAQKRGQPIYLCGGALRDCLLGNAPKDIDLTIGEGSHAFLQDVQTALGCGTIVLLGARQDDTCRLVVRGFDIDVSGFRGGAATIEDDLLQRDFSVNAIAADLSEVVTAEGPLQIIDPTGGLQDMADKVLRVCPGAFGDDPLRMLRAYRFSLSLGYRIGRLTREAIRTQVRLIGRSASERIRSELDQMMSHRGASRVFSDMAVDGLMAVVMPELWEGDGIDQPAFHHLDVLRHNLLTLECVDRVIEDAESFFPGHDEALAEYLADPDAVMMLRWAALFHDVGKPATKKIVAEKGGRVTFYGHDEEGRWKFLAFAERLRWSRHNRENVAGLISMHMHPFHLCNVRRSEGGLSVRARLKICRKAGNALPGLFVLAMADSLAGQGEDKPEGMEEEVAALYSELGKMYRESVVPVLDGPKLLTGHDLIDTLGLAPGPWFKDILEALDLAVIDGEVKSRDGAVEWVSDYIARKY